MSKFLRNFSVSKLWMVGAFAFLVAAVFGVQQLVHALPLPIASITGSIAAYDDTGYDVTVFFNTGSVVSGDVVIVQLDSSNDSGALSESFSFTGTLDNSNAGGMPFMANIPIDYSTFTGCTLYLHAWVNDSTGDLVDYGIQAIIFSPLDGDACVDWTSVYSGVGAALAASGIANNFDTVTSGNVNSFYGLYFETSYGRIVFEDSLDLADSNVQLFLQSLPTYFSTSGGYINFRPTGSGTVFNVPAEITMFFPTAPFIGTTDATDYLIVKDGSGNVLSGGDLSDVFGSTGTIECGEAETGWCSFEVSHFTSFEFDSGSLPTFSCTGVLDVPVAECNALVDLYNSTNGANWTTHTYWLGQQDIDPTTVCDRYGVDCDQEIAYSSFGGVYAWAGPSYVARLNLAGNNLSGSLPASLASLTGLEYLYLQNNHITNIPANTFAGMTDLYSLYLFNNDITTIGTGAFSGLSSVRDLYLYDNNITNIPANAFAGLTSLQRLGLQNNNISSIGIGAFSGLDHVLQLRLQENSLTTIPDDAFSTMSRLRILYLNDNHLTTLPGSLTGPNNLWSLDASHNCIRYGGLSTELNDFLTGLYWFYPDENSMNDDYCPAHPISVDDEGGTTRAGSIYVFDHTSTGATFNNDVTIRIEESEGSDNYLEFTTSGFVIGAASGWDGILYAPTTGEDPNLGYGKNVLFTVQAGSHTSSLTGNAGNSGWYFKVSFVVSEGTSGQVLKIYRSENGTTRGANRPEATCTLTADKICKFRTDHLSYFTAFTETSGSPSGGGGSLQKDNCPDGDFSASFYDRICGVSVSTGAPAGQNSTITGGIIGSPYSVELNDAYLYAFRIGITTMPSIQQADMEGLLIRSHMAKMMVNYAIKVLDMTPDTTKACEFNDIADQTSELKGYIKLSCQLGLMGVGMQSFEPNAFVTRAQFGTILSRALYGIRNEGGVPYYLKHLTALKIAGIMNNITDPELMKELRGYVMLMLMRANK